MLRKLGLIFIITATAYAGGVAGHADALEFFDKLFGKERTKTENTSPPVAVTTPAPQALSQPVRAPEQVLPSYAPVIKLVAPAVVNISTKLHIEVQQQQNPLMNDPFFRQFFGINPQALQPQKREAQSVGSGVIIDAAKGYILTNNHVVKGSEEIYVNLSDKRRLKAKLIGADAETDLAILKIEAQNLTAIKVGASNNLEIGDFVIAIGNPFGLGQTVTHGIISALGRNGLGIEGFEDFIQTDAAINPGNSGGALINLRGELIGINTAIVSKNGGSVGIGFAIPVDMAKSVMAQLIEGKTIERGQLGLNIQDLTPDIASALNLKSSSYAGAVVAGVFKNSSGEKAGIKEGDVITKFNSVLIDSAADLRNMVGMSKVGDKVKLTLLRDGKELELAAIIEKKTKEIGVSAVTTNVPQLKGAKIAAIGPKSEYYGKVEGVIVEAIEPNSPATLTGLEVGDIITSVNRKKVTNPGEFLTAAGKNPKTLLLNLIRGNMAMFIAIQ